MTRTISMKPLLALVIQCSFTFLVGCTNVREDPDDSFAARPENATSASYQIVRLGEGRYEGALDKSFLLKKIEYYRQDYEVEKTADDFGTDYVSKRSYDDYQKKLKSFKDSDLDAAEAYLNSLKEEIAFVDIGQDKGKYDIGDIDWCEYSRKLRVVDFYGQYYNDDWSPYAFIINMIPTSKDGYAKLELAVKGETLNFRKKARKNIWRFRPNYFWVYANIFVMEGASEELPMLLQIRDPNDHGDMNGTYLIMPKDGVDLGSKLTTKSNFKVTISPKNVDAWTIISEGKFAEAEIVYGEMSRGRSKEDVLKHFKKYRKWAKDEALILSLIELYEEDRQKYKERLSALDKK